MWSLSNDCLVSMTEYVGKYRAATQHEVQMQSEFLHSQMQKYPAVAAFAQVSNCLNDWREKWQID